MESVGAHFLKVRNTVILVLLQRGMLFDPIHLVLSEIFWLRPIMPPVLGHGCDGWYRWWPERPHLSPIASAPENLIDAQMHAFSKGLISLFDVMQNSVPSYRALCVVQILRFLCRYSSCVHRLPALKEMLHRHLQKYATIYSGTGSIPLDFIQKEVLCTYWQLFGESPLPSHVCVVWGCSLPRHPGRYTMGLCSEHLSLRRIATTSQSSIRKF